MGTEGKDKKVQKVGKDTHHTNTRRKGRNTKTDKAESGSARYLDTQEQER